MSKKEKPRPVYKQTGLTDEEALEMIRLVNENPNCLVVADESDEDGGRVVLSHGSVKAARSMGACEDFMNILLWNNYEVTAHLEDDKTIDISFRPYRKKVDGTNDEQSNYIFE